jgi:hypothetical protein
LRRRGTVELGLPELGYGTDPKSALSGWSELSHEGMAIAPS